MNQKQFGLLLVGTLIVVVIGLIIFKMTNQSNDEADSSVLGQTTMATPTPSIKQYSSFPILTPDQLQNKKAMIETAKGTIEFQIEPEATKAASSFIFLTNNHFFDGLTFHRVVPGFVIQGGDPLGNGTGGPGYQFADEPVIGSYTTGTVAMANAGPNTNGSQFFIMLADHPELPPSYTIFGHVIVGQDVVEKIQQGDVMQKVTIEDIK